MLRLVGSVVGNHFVSVFLPLSAILFGFAVFFCLLQRNPNFCGSWRENDGDDNKPESNEKIKNKTVEGTRLLENHRDLIRKNGWHLNPNLKLIDLARRLGTPQKQLSILINVESGENFKHFINELRIEFSKDLLKRKDLRITDIAAASGFNSESVFYDQFRKFAEIAPGEYRKRFQRTDEQLDEGKPAIVTL